MNDNRINMNVKSCNMVTGAHITHIYINQSPDNVNEKSLDSKLLVNIPVELHSSNSNFASKESASLYSGNINEGKNAVVKVLNDSTSCEYSKVFESSPLILDTNETYSCHICINDNDTLNSMGETVKPNSVHTEYIAETSCSLSEDDECYSKYSIADIDELVSDSVLNDGEPSILSNESSYEYYSSNDSLVSDSEADGIVMFLDKSNIEVRI